MMRIALLLAVTCCAFSAQETGARYLIITHDNFYNHIIPLAEWKHKKGMRTKVVKLSEIGSDSLSIRNYIADAYNTWQTKPEFLLLVGAPNYIPFPVINYWHTDNYYTNVISTDIYNEILSGRLTVHDSMEIKTVVSKILLYERTPSTSDSLWFKKACLILRNDYDPGDTVYWGDIHHAKNLMLQAGYHTVDTLASQFGNNANDVIQNVNQGRGFVLYRGQGLNSWWSPFDVNPNNTANGTKLPIVLSITCRTMGTSSSPAYAEQWFLTGTPTSPRGAAGYFATTTVGGGSITLRRSAVCRGFFSAVFNDNVRTFGEACEGGRRNVYSIYNDADEYRGFTTIGDPEMNIWTDTPCSLTVSHPQAVTVGNASFTINVTRAANSIPVRGAMICLIGKSDTTVYASDSTDAAGNAYFNIYPLIVLDTIYVTVTGRNLKPYEGSMFTYAPGRYVGYLKSVIDDSLGGNNDGIINPGEQINLPLWVKNYGDSTAFNVVGILRSGDVYTAVTDSIKSFGTILGGDSVFTGNDGYNFAVASSAPDAHIINFELLCTDINDSVWTSYISQIVHAAVLDFQCAQISGGNGNSYFEPAETVNVITTIRNEGSAGIDSVTAHLRSLSTYVGVIDSLGSFDNIPPNSNASNEADPFILYSDPNTPQGMAAEFQLILSAGYYCDTLDFSLCIGGKHYLIWNPDATPMPGQNMHILLSDLGYVGDYDTILATDLDLYQSVWACVGVWPNNHVILSGSAEATGLVDYVQNGGCMYLEGGDVWWYDPGLGGHDFSSLFGIDALADGSDDMGPIIGQTNTFTLNMNFEYEGENSFMDHVGPGNMNALLIFRDGDDNYQCGVAHDAGGYRTVGTSFELGLLTDSIVPSTRAILLDSIMHFFGVATGIKETQYSSTHITYAFDIFPNPSRGKVVMKYSTTLFLQENVRIVLKIYDACGRLINQLHSDPNQGLEDNTLIWYGQDEKGRKLPNGVYFVNFEANDFTTTKKLILLK
jgi:hypothetical protein